MPVWTSPVPEHVKVGQRMPELPGMWVAEIVDRVPVSVLIRNHNAREWNKRNPDGPFLDLEPEVLQRHARLCGPQLRLVDV